MIVIQRRYNGAEFEQIATYEDGSLEGDDDFVDAFGYIFEGEVDESIILERFSGPNLVASIPEEESDSLSSLMEERESDIESSQTDSGVPETHEIDKYRVYISDVDSLSEAEEEAPDWADVQEGTQGGFFYNTNDKPGEGDDDDDEKLDPEQGVTGSFPETGGFEVEEFGNVYAGLGEQNITQGDLLYVEHPTDPDYIAEVDEISGSYGDWDISFGGGTYSLHPDTNSQPVGGVVEEPELGPNEELVSVNDAHELDEGDTIAYTDPAGYQHYVEVDTIESLNGTIYTDAGELKENEVDGKVVVNDPTEKYDIPTPEQLEETTNITDVERAEEFAENVAKAVAEGDATEISCRPYQYYVSALQDEDLAIKTYRSIVNNDGSATHREQIERQLRSMDIDPQEVHPNEFEFDPEEVPESRVNTKYSNFDSDKATKTVAHAIQNNQIGSNNWSEWNDFLDTLTPAEKEEALQKAFESEILRDTYGDEPMDYEDDKSPYDDDGMSVSTDSPDLYASQVENASSIFTRIGRDDKQRQREIYETFRESMPTDKKQTFDEEAAKWLPSADVRREIAEEQNLFGGVSERSYTMQFAEDHEDRAEAFLSAYVGSTTADSTQVGRAMLMEYDVNEDSSISQFNNGLATKSIEPPDEFSETIDQLREESAEYIEEEHDGEVTLYRGLQNKITSNASAESWSDDHSTANGHFDGYAVLKAEFEPGDVIATHHIQDHYDWGYYKHANENEWTCLGGPLAEAIPEDMTPAKYFGEKKGEEPGAPTADLE